MYVDILTLNSALGKLIKIAEERVAAYEITNKQKAKVITDWRKS